MLSSASHPRIYYGVKKWTWLQALTLVHILPRESELRYDCIKQKPLKGISTSSCPFFKNTSENIGEKSKQRKRVLWDAYVVLSGVKALNVFNLVNWARL